jgi:hypothetical protein
LLLKDVDTFLDQVTVSTCHLTAVNGSNLFRFVEQTSGEIRAETRNKINIVCTSTSSTWANF